MPSLGLAEARTWQLKIQRWRREPQAPHSGGSAPCSCRLPSDSRRRCGSSCAQPGGSVPETCSSCIWNTCALARHSTSPAPSTPCRTHTHAALHVHRTSLVSRVCSPLARRQAAPRAPGSSPAFGVGADACAVRQPRPPPFRPQLPRVSRSALSHTHRCSAALPAPPSKQPMQASRQEAGGRCARASRLCSAPPVTSGSVPVSAPLLQHANVFWIGLLGDAQRAQLGERGVGKPDAGQRALHVVSHARRAQMQQMRGAMPAGGKSALPHTLAASVARAPARRAPRQPLGAPAGLCSLTGPASAA